MNDQSIHSAAKISLATGAAIWLALAAPAHAGDKVIYGDAPEWVDKVALSRVNVSFSEAVKSTTPLFTVGGTHAHATRRT